VHWPISNWIVFGNFPHIKGTCMLVVLCPVCEISWPLSLVTVVRPRWWYLTLQRASFVAPRGPHSPRCPCFSLFRFPSHLVFHLL
jgi:hypothetical protein